MKNKQHKYIIKAFLESEIPTIIRRNAPELMIIDSIIGGHCTRIIKYGKLTELNSNELISKKEKEIFSKLINQSTGIEKVQLLQYYRLVLLVEIVLTQYKL